MQKIQKLQEDWLVLPGYDSIGHDIKYIKCETLEEFIKEALKDPNCVAFNTLGYFKDAVNPIEKLENVSKKFNNFFLFINKNRNLKNTEWLNRHGKHENLQIVGKSFVLDEWLMIPKMDSPGHDIFYSGPKTHSELKSLAFSDERCIAFNTAGYFKDLIEPEDKWIDASPHNENFFMYIHKERYRNLNNYDEIAMELIKSGDLYIVDKIFTCIDEENNKFVLHTKQKNKYRHILSSVSNKLTEESQRDKVLKMYDIYWTLFEKPHKNMEKYIDTLNLKQVSLEKLVDLDENEKHYVSCNPSIVKYKDGYLINVRYVNYTQKGAINYDVMDTDKIVKTANYLVRTDDKFNKICQCKILESAKRTKYPNHVTGMEDIRLFWGPDDILRGVCTILDSRNTHVAQIGIFNTGISQNKDIIDCDIVVDVEMLESPENLDCEKNWLPYSDGNKLKLFYWHTPTTIYELKDGKLTLDVIKNQEFPTTYRGSAGPISYKNGYLMLIHTHLWYAGVEGRNYIHKFLHYDKDFNLLQTSEWFFFDHMGIEFCPSMTWDHDMKTIILGYGWEDCTANLLFLSTNKLEEILKKPMEISFI